MIELVGDQNPGPEAPPRSKIGRERKEQRRSGDRAAARGAMEKSRYVRVIKGEEARGDDSIEYFSPQGLQVPFESQRGR